MNTKYIIIAFAVVVALFALYLYASKKSLKKDLWTGLPQIPFELIDQTQKDADKLPLWYDPTKFGYQGELPPTAQQQAPNTLINSSGTPVIVPPLGR